MSTFFKEWSLLKHSVLVAQLFMLFLSSVSAASEAQVEEYTLKAAYIEKFTRFIEWPKESGLDDTSKPFVIGIIGETSFEPVLRKSFSTRKIREKDVVVRRVSNMDEISGCHLLFISNIPRERLGKVLSSIKGKPVLTVSDVEGFAMSGVLINFYVLNSKLRFEINEMAVRETNLVFSYKLMQIAKIVNPTESR